jgi:uncharacterized protein
MSAAENKKLLQEIYAGAAKGDGRLFFQSLAEDVVWTVTGQYSWSRSFRGKEAIKTELFGHLRAVLEPPLKTIAHRFIAEDDHVVIEARGDNVSKDGQRYDNQYCMVYRLEDGKIAEIREYCDSILVERVLGPNPKRANAASD